MTSAKKIAAIQMVSTVDVELNMARAFALLERASNSGASIALLPENFAVFNAAALYDQALQEQQTQFFTRAISQWAQSLSLWIIAGTIPMLPTQQNNGGDAHDEKAKCSRKVNAACCVFSPAGICVARYNKIHLFDVDVTDSVGSYRESNDIMAGDTPCLVDVDGVPTGLSICYDLRFPSLYQTLSGAGAKLITVPSAFTYHTGQAHWEPLLRARAIETQSYIVAANQGGQHTPNRKTWGHSMIIDPWGHILAQAEQGEAVVLATYDFERVQDIRSKMPIQSHRKPSCYT